MNPIDSEIVRLANAGSEEAWRTIYGWHQPKVFALMMRMTGSTTEAEDLTQDAFLQVFRKLAGFRGESRLSTWIYRVAVNVALMRFRRQKHSYVSIDAMLEDSAINREPPVLQTEDRRLKHTVDRIALTRAIAELPTGYRTVFVLHEVEGYQHEEIAEILSRSVGLSKSQLHKSKHNLRQSLSVRAIKARASRSRTMVRQAL